MAKRVLFRVSVSASFAVFFFLSSSCVAEDPNAQYDDFVYQAGNQPASQFGQAKATKMRYLLFTVNPGEGFNLRHNVYMRIANLVKLLNARSPWTLVLPPWGRLYHWKSNVEQERIPWRDFFDVASLRRHVPVVEFADFIEKHGFVDKVYHLQGYAEGWKDGKWEDKMDIRDCIENHGFHKDEAGRWRWWFWGYEEAYARDFVCLSLQMEYSLMVNYIEEETAEMTSIMLMRGEQITHGEFSEWSREWWTARRSIRFSQRLIDAADELRATELDSNDVDDKTERSEDWRDTKKVAGDALGGPYVAVHLRRRDYERSHPESVPSVTKAAERIRAALLKTGLNTVYISTDAHDDDYLTLELKLNGVKVVRFERPLSVVDKYKDGGVAIIDQWISAHARYFIGTSSSTFSFRIQEERELLGFPSDTTCNCFCADKEPNCQQPTHWPIKY